jgi:elongation factor P
MISPSEIKNGTAIMLQNDPWIVVEFQHINPGKGSAFVRTRLKNLKTAKVLEHTFKVSEKIEEANVNFKRLNYLYKDEENFYFMDEDYEQLFLSKDIVAKREDFLIEEARVDGVFLEGNLIEINLPKKMVFAVIEAPPGIKGDSATSANKFVTIETGAKVAVPLFIKEGDKIKVNTETGSYDERVNN